MLLERRRRIYVCTRGHSYDIARSGYINLLQPQDRRSLHAGDSAEAIAARSRLLSRGVGAATLEAVADRVLACAGEHGVVADIGSGSGELVRELLRRRPITGVGIDLSVAAADHAARAVPGATWVVANADRRLPLLDRTIDVIVSMHGRRNPAECARVLTRHGCLVTVVPAPDDLIELRATVQGQAVERERGPHLVQEHAHDFQLVEQTDLRERHTLRADSLRDLLRGTYRGERKGAAERIASLQELEVTLASSLFLFKRRDSTKV